MKLQSSTNSAHLKMKKTKTNQWDGEMVKKNCITLDKPFGHTVLEQTKQVEFENSQMTQNHENVYLRKRPLDINIQKQKKLGVIELQMENSEQCQIVEEEVEKSGFINHISKQESQVCVKSRSKMGKNRISLNLLQNKVGQKNLIRDIQGDKTEETLMKQKLELVKENKENEDRVIVETCRLRGNQLLNEEQIRVTSKIEVKKTLIQVPQDEKQIARIEIINEQRICVDDSNEKEGNYKLNMVSRVNLETSDISVVKKKTLTQDLIQEMQSEIRSNKDFSYENLQRGLDPFQVRKEVCREERKKEKGILVTVKRDKKVRVIAGSEDEKMDTTAQENEKFIIEHKEMDILNGVYQKALDVINIPTSTIQMISNKFNGTHFIIPAC